MISLDPLRRLRRIAAPAAIVLLAACGGDGPTPPPPPPPIPTTLTIVGGNTQQGTVGSVLPNPLVARVLDAQGRPIAGAIVNWQVNIGGGTITPTSAATDAAGEARAQWTLGTTAGANTGLVTIAGLAAQVLATGVPGPVAAVVATPETVLMEVGDLGQVTATARDAFGNAVNGRVFQWSVVQGTAVTVDANGQLRTQAPGSAKVAATLDGRADTVDVTVFAAPTVSYDVVSAGGVATCALGGAGLVYCWGANTARQLGRAAGGDLCDGLDCSLVPVAAQSQETFLTLSAGRDGGCAISWDRRLHCWGDDAFTSPVAAPQVVAPSARAVGVGEGFFCYATEAGEANCRGINDYGQIGNGSADRFTGGPVSGNLVFGAIDAGNHHACGLTAKGAAYCWGRNDKGQLGAATTEFCNGVPCSRVPVAVTGGEVFKSITVGRDFTCAIRDLDRKVLCWGSNHTGQLGTGSTATTVATPTVVALNQPFTMVDAAGLSEWAGHACGVTTAGQLYCWGANSRGELGTTQPLSECSTPQGPYTCSRVPLPVADLFPPGSWRGVGAGMNHTCGVTTRGRVYCFGENVFGQLGDGTRANRSTPTLVRDPRA